MSAVTLTEVTAAVADYANALATYQTLSKASWGLEETNRAESAKENALAEAEDKLCIYLLDNPAELLAALREGTAVRR